MIVTQSKYSLFAECCCRAGRREREVYLSLRIGKEEWTSDSYTK